MQYLSGIKVKFQFAHPAVPVSGVSSFSKRSLAAVKIKLLQDNRSTICRFPSTSPPDPQAHRGTPTLGGGVFLWNKIANLAGLNRRTIEFMKAEREWKREVWEVIRKNLLNSNLERLQGLTESDYKSIRDQRDCPETAKDQTGAPSLRPCRNWT